MTEIDFNTLKEYSLTITYNNDENQKTTRLIAANNLRDAITMLLEQVDDHCIEQYSNIAIG